MTDTEPMFEETREAVLNRVAKRLGLPHRLGKNADRGEVEQMLCLVVDYLARAQGLEQQPGTTHPDQEKLGAIPNSS